MALVVYIKAKPKAKGFSLNKKTERYFLGVLSLIGFTAIIFAIYPYFSWRLKTLPKLTAKIEQAPVPTGQVLSSGTIENTNVQVVQDPDGFSYFTTDYKPQSPRPNEFTISIPKLKIEGALAKVDTLRFDSNLSHFPGSAIPGQVGNSFVTGHSVLPQFNDPQNYRAIFSKLPDLEVGDEVIVEIEGKKLNFVVQYAKVVDPRDLSVLSPISQNSRSLTLMTCVPPGTNLKRLVVVTSLI